MGNTSDKNLDVWQHIAKELHQAIDAREDLDDCNRRTAEASSRGGTSSSARTGSGVRCASAPSRSRALRRMT